MLTKNNCHDWSTLQSQCRPQGPRISSRGFFTLTYSDANQPLVPGDVLSLLSEPAIGPPHGYDLLQPLPIPNFPSFPDRPSAGIPTEKPFSVLGWSFGAPRLVAKDGFSPKILEKERQLLEQTETLRQNSCNNLETLKHHLGRCSSAVRQTTTKQSDFF